MTDFPYRRMVVIGTTSSGKSTLAQQLAQKLNVDFIELDALHWEPNWTPAADNVFRARADQATFKPRWVSSIPWSSRGLKSVPIRQAAHHIMCQNCVTGRALAFPEQVVSKATDRLLETLAPFWEVNARTLFTQKSLMPHPKQVHSNNAGRWKYSSIIIRRRGI